MFIPKRMKEWKPEHMQGVPCRRCHWCSSGPHRMYDLTVVLEAPMRYHFCKPACIEAWKEHRHEPVVVTWLRAPAGVRAEILKLQGNGRCS